MKITHEQARKDHEYLWAIAPANDMTGGYVDQEDLDLMLQNPTRAQATKCYCSQISYWFSVGPDLGKGREVWQELGDPILSEIAERHGIHTDEVHHD